MPDTRTRPSYKKHFGRFLHADRLHFAAHSHHLWPDVSLDAHAQAWRDAARDADRKWDRILGEVLPEARGHLTRILGLSDPATIAFAPNTHELVVRIFSCFEGHEPVRVLTTDAEFHSFRRQLRRWEESGRVRAERVPAEPFASFPERFAERAASGDHDLVYLSHVQFDSGYVVPDLTAIVAAVPRDDAFVVVDGYHAFMALPVDLAAIEARAFWLAGGYKYAMTGEGACFCHCPPGYGERPVDTGWYAGFDDLARPDSGRVAYATGGDRFFGATFDVSPFYRFNAVMGLWREVGVTPADVHERALALEARFLDGLDGLGLGTVRPDRLIPDRSFADRGNFLTFRFPGAAEAHARLLEAGVITDCRGNRLRIGFGLYHDDEDVDRLLLRMAERLA